jgi:hypothetical protein
LNECVHPTIDAEGSPLVKYDKPVATAGGDGGSGDGSGDGSGSGGGGGGGGTLFTSFTTPRILFTIDARAER